LAAILLRALPVRQPQALVRLAVVAGRGNQGRSTYSFAEFVRASETGNALEGLLATETTAATVHVAGGIEQVAAGEIVSGNYLDVLGVG
jgi:hypothetical protein